jgi:hypothetical protein
MGQQAEQVVFHSDGLKLAGELYLPDEAGTGSRAG